MKPGQLVIITIPTWASPEGAIGIVSNKNLTDGLISVRLLESDEMIMDFDSDYLEVQDD